MGISWLCVAPAPGDRSGEVRYHRPALYNGHSVGAWRSLVARIVRDDEVGGSNPLAPTKLTDLAVELKDPWEDSIEPEMLRHLRRLEQT